jgi:hypothetical protein
MNQQLTITIEFTSAHVPDTEEHLKQVAENYLRGKGVVLQDGIIKI